MGDSGVLLKNTYIDTVMQKGGVAGFADCIGHISAVTQLIGEAKKMKLKDLGGYITCPENFTLMLTRCS